MFLDEYDDDDDEEETDSFYTGKPPDELIVSELLKIITYIIMALTFLRVTLFYFVFSRPRKKNTILSINLS